MSTRLLYRLLMPGLVLAFYFLVPTGESDAPIGIWLGLLLSVGCVGGVVAILTAEVRRAEHRLQPIHLVLALELVLVGFALGYYVLNFARPGEFSESTPGSTRSTSRSPRPRRSASATSLLAGRSDERWSASRWPST